MSDSRGKVESQVSLRSNVALWRRILTTLSDIFIYFSSLVLLGLEERYLTTPLLIFSIFYFFLNFWYLPRYTGYTISHWLFGYQILRNDQSCPLWNDLLKRNVTMGILNKITFGLLDTIVLLIRKDKRTLHDMASGMTPKRVTSQFRFLRVVLVVSIAVISLLTTVKYVVEQISVTYVDPVKYERWYEIEELHSLSVDLPLTSDTTLSFDTLIFPETNFYLLVDTSTVILGDSFIVVNSDTMNYENWSIENAHLTTASEYETSSFIEKFLSLQVWTIEELFRDFNQFPEEDISLFNPERHLRKMVSGIIGAIALPSLNDVVQRGTISTNGTGNYYYLENENLHKSIVIDIWQENDFNSLFFHGTNISQENARYILEHISIFPQDTVL